MNSPLLLHIGLPKTGTTSIQSFSSGLAGVYCLAKPGYQECTRYATSFSKIYKSNSFSSDDKKVLIDSWREAIECSPPKLFLISEENLTNQNADMDTISARLSELGFSFRINITLRKPQALAASYYLMELRKRRLPEHALTSFDHYLNYQLDLFENSRKGLFNTLDLAGWLPNLCIRLNTEPKILWTEELSQDPLRFYFEFFRGEISRTEIDSGLKGMEGKRERRRQTIGNHFLNATTTKIQIRRVIPGKLKDILKGILDYTPRCNPKCSSEWSSKLASIEDRFLALEKSRFLS